MKNLSELDMPDENKREVTFYLTVRKIVLYLFATYLVSSILLGLFTDISLTLDYTNILFVFLCGLLAIGFFIQARLYFLFKKIGEGKEFLKKQVTIFGVIVFAFALYFIFQTHKY